jgi:hypothetical protein
MQLLYAFLALAFSLSSLAVYAEWIRSYLVIATELDRYFNFHVLFGVLSVTVCLLPSSMLFKAGLPLKRYVIKYVHAALYSLCFAFMVTAVVFIWKNHEGKDLPHVYTPHGWLGISLVLLVCAQWVFGVAGFLLELLSGPVRKVLLEWHRFLGGVLVVLSVSVLVSGTAEKVAFNKESGHTVFNNVASTGSLLVAVAAVLCSFVLWRGSQEQGTRAEHQPLVS